MGLQFLTSFSSRRSSFYLFAVLVTVLMALLQWYDPPLIRETIESKTYDLRQRLNRTLTPLPPQDTIQLVVIDEQSLQRYGRWPWSRQVMARLVTAIAAGGPKVIGIDILFSEPESAEADRALAQAIKEAGNVVLAVGFSAPDATSPPATLAMESSPLWDAAFMEVKSIGGLPWKTWIPRGVKPLVPGTPIAESAAALGHVMSHPDADGVLRWELLALLYQDDVYPSLPLQVARLAQGLPPEDLGLYGGCSIRFGSRFIPTDISSRALIKYRGSEGSYPTISASDLLDSTVSAKMLRGKIVLIGGTAHATYDQKISPLSANLPGVEKNATVVENILTTGFNRRSPGVIELAVILGSSLLLILLLPRLSPGAGVTLGTTLICTYLAVTVILSARGVWLSLVYPFVNIAAILTAETVVKMMREEQAAKRIRSIFSSYVSPKIVETLIRNPEKLSLGGERKQVSIMFCDLVGFTTLSEKLPPEEVVALLNEYYREMAEIIFRWDGTLDKFVGDEIMAIWGAPIEQPDHAERALRCALHMSTRLDQLQEKWLKEGKDVLECGIGINSGEVLIGNIGLPGKKMDYTAIGNHVNIAARVEKLTRSYQRRILITGETMSMLDKLPPGIRLGHVTFEMLGSVTVKGKTTEINILGVVPEPHPA